MNKLRTNLIIILLLLTAPSLYCQKDYKAIEKSLDRLIDSIRNESKLYGVTAYIRNPEFTYSAATGLGDIKTDVPRKINDKIRIGSITKTFVATVILQLQDEGKLSIHDKLSMYYPDYPNSENITLKEMLDMTSGIPDYIMDPGVLNSFVYDRTHKYTPEELYEITKKMKPLFPPGKGWEYSNGNYNILGMLIEKLTGKKIQDEIDSRIIKPLGLKNTVFPVTAEMDGQYSHGYFKDTLKKELTDVTVIDPSITWAAGCMISDFDDLEIYVKALVEGTLISRKSQEERLTFADTKISFVKYGLGIFTIDGFIGHNGGITGYNTTMFYNPVLKTTALVSVNEFNGDSGMADHIFGELMKTLYPEKNLFNTSK